MIDSLIAIRKNYLVSNISWLLFANAATRLIAFLYVIYLARSLGVEKFGIHVYGLTVFGLVSTFTDFGLNRLLTREVAKDKSQLNKYLNNIFTLAVLWSLAAAILVVLLMFAIDNDSTRRIASIFFILTVIPFTLAATISATFNAIEKLKLVALGLTLTSLGVTLFGVAAISIFNSGIIGVAVGFLLAHLVLLAFYFLLARREKIQIKLDYDFDFWKKSFMLALPYGILTVLGLIYFKIDTILLTILKGNEITGYYGASYRFLEAVHFIPASVMVVLFPVMARLHLSSRLELKALYLRSIKLLGLVGILVFLLLFVFADLLISTLYGGQYRESILALRILSVAVIFMFLHVPGAHLLFATEKYLKSVIVLSVFTVLVNVVLNLIFIPKYGLLAASVITVFSEILSFAVFSILIWTKVLSKDEVENRS